MSALKKAQENYKESLKKLSSYFKLEQLKFKQAKELQEQLVVLKVNMMAFNKELEALWVGTLAEYDIEKEFNIFKGLFEKYWINHQWNLLMIEQEGWALLEQQRGESATKGATKGATEAGQENSELVHPLLRWLVSNEKDQMSNPDEYVDLLKALGRLDKVFNGLIDLMKVQIQIDYKILEVLYFEQVLYVEHFKKNAEIEPEVVKKNLGLIMLWFEPLFLMDQFLNQVHPLATEFEQWACVDHFLQSLAEYSHEMLANETKIDQLLSDQKKVLKENLANCKYSMLNFISEIPLMHQSKQELEYLTYYAHFLGLVDALGTLNEKGLTICQEKTVNLKLDQVSGYIQENMQLVDQKKMLIIHPNEPKNQLWMNRVWLMQQFFNQKFGHQMQKREYDEKQVFTLQMVMLKQQMLLLSVLKNDANVALLLIGLAKQIIEQVEDLGELLKQNCLDLKDLRFKKNKEHVKHLLTSVNLLTQNEKI